MKTAGLETPLLKVLLIEDNPGDVDLAREALAEGPSRVRFMLHDVARLDDALQKLAVEPADVVLLDLNLPDAEGLESLERLRKTVPDTPVVVLTGLSDEETAIEAVHLGAQDYLIKGTQDGATLVRTIRYAIERHRLLAELDRNRRIIEEANRKLRDLDRMKTLFLANVSHELRTPLTSVEGFTENMREGLLGEVTPRQQQTLDRILANARRLRKLIEDLLDMSRIEAGRIRLRIEPFDAAALLDDLALDYRPRCQERNIDLRLTRPEGFREATGDAVRIRQVLDNLVSNAVKFTPPGGRIEVSVAASPADGSAVFTVQDSGPGIPESEQTKIFDRFYQVSRPSTRSTTGFGLGLAISRELVELHNGHLWVESRPGQGSRFCLKLPGHTRPPAAAPQTPAGDPGRDERRKSPPEDNP